MKYFSLKAHHQIAIFYCLFTTTWILVTDIAVALVSRQLLIEHSAKGLLFVIVTTGCLVWLLERHNQLKSQTEQERDDAVETYRVLFEQHGLPQLLINPANGQIVRANEAAAAYYGWTVSQLCSMTIANINLLAETDVFTEMIQAQMRRCNHFQFRHRLSSGDVREVEVYSHPVRLYGQALLYSIIVDVSKQQQSQRALEQSNRLLKAFVSCSRAMMLYHDRQGIADAVTRALVEEGQYTMAWIGLVSKHSSEPIHVFSHWGDTHHYLDHIAITWDNTPTGTGPTGRAIKSGQPQWVQNIPSAAEYQPWHQQASDSQFRSSAALPLVQSNQVFAVLNLYSHQENAFEREEVNYLETLAADLSRTLVTVDSVTEYNRVNSERLAAIARARAALFEAVAVLSDAVEIRDPYTAGHQNRVAWLAVAIGNQIHLSEEQLETLHVAALLHDIGKIAVPTELLVKPGRLNPVEFELIKQHPQVGETLLKKVSFESPIAAIVGQHHERMDGTGYPRGLMGHHILLEARVIAVADVVEAMISHRPYRPGLLLEKAYAELEAGQHSKYDPDVVAACLTVMQQGGYDILGHS